MNSPRPWVVVDLDGTLLDIRRRHYRAFTSSLRAGQRGPGLPAYWQRVRRGEPLSLDDAGRRRFIARIEQPSLLRTDRPAPGAGTFLRRAGATFRLMLLTGRRHAGRMRDQLNRLGWRGHVNRIVSSSAGAHTPAARARLVRRVGLRPREILALLGDTGADVRTARQLGVPGLAIDHGMRNSDVLRRERPAFICRTLNDAYRHLVRLGNIRAYR